MSDSPDLDYDGLLKRLGACSQARCWSHQAGDLKTCWLECALSDSMMWAIDKLGLFDEPRARTFGCRLTRGKPLEGGRTVWKLLAAPDWNIDGRRRGREFINELGWAVVEDQGAFVRLIREIWPLSVVRAAAAMKWKDLQEAP